MQSDRNDIPALDSEIADRVAFDSANNVAYVESAYQHHPLILTWLARCARLNLTIRTEVLPRDEILEKRKAGLRSPGATADDHQSGADEGLRNWQRAYNLIDTAARYGANDIHLETRHRNTTIQFVINGECRIYDQDTREQGEALMRSFWNGHAGTKDASWESLECQSGQIPDDKLPPGRNLTSVRIIRAPSYPVDQGGLMMTLRLQYAEGIAHGDESSKVGLRPLPLPRVPAGTFSPTERGFTEAQADKLDILLSHPYGAIAVVGPTGAGKTTLLHELMKERKRRRPGGRIVTIEDPVEIPFDFGLQLVVTNASTDDERTEKYEQLAHATLRMAPNTLMFGEIRSAGVGIAAVQGVQTGHDTWLTMHVLDPFRTIERFETLDNVRLNRRVICDPDILPGIIGVRLLAELCDSCKQPLSAPTRFTRRIHGALETWGDIANVYVRGAGCKACGGSGHIGRTMVAEIILTDEDLMRDFIEKGTTVARDNYRERDDADPSMLETAIQRVLEGRVDPFVVEEKVGLIRARKARGSQLPKWRHVGSDTVSQVGAEGTRSIHAA